MTQQEQEEESRAAALDVRVPVRLTAVDAARLRELAHMQRIQPAVLARAAVLDFLERGAAALPPVPPAQEDLSAEVRALLQIVQPLVSNLAQLRQVVSSRAADLGLATDVGEGIDRELERLREAARQLALAARGGEISRDRAAALAAVLAEPGQAINSIARECHTGRLVPAAQWPAPLKAARAVLLGQAAT